jgi:hypothetical protein
MSAEWLFSPRIPLAIFPLGVYALFHIMSYIRTKLLNKYSLLYDVVGKFILRRYDQGMTVVCICEAALWVRVLVSVILAHKNSWIQLCGLSVFLRLRWEMSTFMKLILYAWVQTLDRVFGETALGWSMWSKVKDWGRQVVEITDLKSYVVNAEVPTESEDKKDQ